MNILIKKGERRLYLMQGQRLIMTCPVALGQCPVGHKRVCGDKKTPEGAYFVCLKRGTGKFGAALGISYPSLRDAQAGMEAGVLDASLLPLFEKAEIKGTRPPWGTPLGGEIYLHGRGSHFDWTAGCIALNDGDMAALYLLCPLKARVMIEA